MSPCSNEGMDHLPLRGAAWAVGLALAACSTACPSNDRGHAPPPTPASARGDVPSSSRPLSIRLEGDPAALYRADGGGGLDTPLARRIESRFGGLRVDPCLQLAARAFLQTMKTVVEPSGAVVLAALRAHRERFANRRVGAIVSGGNTDFHWLCEWIRGEAAGCPAERRQT